MTHRLQRSTRHLATAVSLTAAAAAADVVHTADGAGWSFAVAALLTLAAVLVARLHEVGIEVDDDEVVVRNVVSTHRIDRDEVLAIAPGQWRSTLLLEDGRAVPTLLRDVDLDRELEVATTRLLDLTALEPAA